jgi:hypothetical protein
VRVSNSATARRKAKLSLYLYFNQFNYLNRNDRRYRHLRGSTLKQDKERAYSKKLSGQAREGLRKDRKGR